MWGFLRRRSLRVCLVPSVRSVEKKWKKRLAKIVSDIHKRRTGMDEKKKKERKKSSEK